MPRTTIPIDDILEFLNREYELFKNACYPDFEGGAASALESVIEWVENYKGGDANAQ